MSTAPRRILVLVEGQTEELFVKRVLAPLLLQHNRALTPKIVTTKRVKDGPNHKGGGSRFGKWEHDLRALFKDTNAVMVTTLLDYYGLPNDFPALAAARQHPTLDQRIIALDRAFSERMCEPRFLPFFLVHEFEALLFAEPTAAPTLPPLVAAALASICTTSGGNPERINDGPATAPSKRITAAFPDFVKILHGPRICEEIGLARLRAKCARLDAWVTQLAAA